MNDIELDELLHRAAAPLDGPLAEEAVRLAEAVVPSRVRRGRLPRARWTLPLVIAGAVVLTGGAGVGVVTMSHWAGVSMPLENVRNETPIPVSWVTESGHREHCRAWVELRNPEAGDGSTLDAAIAAHDWSGLGQRLYDDARAPQTGDADGERRVNDGLTPVIRDFVGEVFPGIAWLSVDTDQSVRAVDIWGMTCVPESS